MTKQGNLKYSYLIHFTFFHIFAPNKNWSRDEEMVSYLILTVGVNSVFGFVVGTCFWLFCLVGFLLHSEI